MPSTIAVIAPGAMGSAVARRLAEHGARVLTLLEGRSEATVKRAHDVGMIPASCTEIAAADLVLAILPPGEAVGLARALAPMLRDSRTKPAYVDCNAISPKTMQQVVMALADTGCDVIDGSIIGGPPRPGTRGPAFYISGDPHRRAGMLASHGLHVRPIDGPIGAASSLKMVYAGLSKGATALGAAVLLAAVRNGCGESLRQELAESAPQTLARLTRAIPDMYPKAYRWIAEMREIAAFLGPDDPAAPAFESFAEIFTEMAADRDGERDLAASLDRLLAGVGDK